MNKKENLFVENGEMKKGGTTGQRREKEIVVLHTLTFCRSDSNIPNS